MDGYECRDIIIEAVPSSGIRFGVYIQDDGTIIIRPSNTIIPEVCSANYANPLIPLEVHIPNNGIIIIRPRNTIISEGCSANYANPPIPQNYKYFCGGWNNGFVIERCSDKSKFVWIPVGSLDSDGTLDGEHFSEKFGRLNFRNEKFSDDAFNEPLKGELLEQLESVEKYGGFYLSCYNISKSSAGKPRSIEGVMPWVNINFYDAKEIASTIEDGEAVKSHLPFGAEYDSVLRWLLQTKVRTLAQIAEDSTKWGKYRDSKELEILRTGGKKEYRDNNIDNLAGTLTEWTQERYGSDIRVIRGGSYHNLGNASPVAYRDRSFPDHRYGDTGFRAALCIK